MMPLQPGSVFAKSYEIVRPISAGGMGVVYEVIHLGTRRHRALKVMLAHIVTDPRMRERFSLEAIVSADIESEHITEIFDAGIDPDTDSPYLVMELLRGEDLGARVKRGERFSAEEVLVLMDQVARALEKTHAQGVVHRDLKPDNLFLTHRDDGSPRIKILDFGIAKIIKNDVSGPQATTKSFGTPFYMAREQITGESSLIGPASDLYAVAQIVFTLLTGSPYFLEEAKGSQGNILSVLMAVGSLGTKDPASERALRRGVALPKSFDAWFAHATALEATGRFMSAAHMVSALRDALREPVQIIGENPDRPLPQSASAPSPGNASASQSNSQGRPVPVAGESVRSAPELFHETGSPQSISTSFPALPQKASPKTAVWIGAAALLGCAIAVLTWKLAATGDATASGSGRSKAASPESAQTSEPAARAPAVTVEPSASGSLAGVATSNATTSASAALPSASASGAAPLAPNANQLPGQRAKPGGTHGVGNASGSKSDGEVWETR